VSVAELLGASPGLRISDPRLTSVQVHAYLRELIVDGTLPPGTELKQAELARIFAVSRTPLREAFRMLQEEGLVSAEPNQRSRVLGIDPDELDMLYAARVTLESLGVRVTAGRLSREDLRSAAGAMREMDRAYRADDMPSWSVAHHRFHRTVVSGCGTRVLRTITSYAEQSERYVRSLQARHRDGFPARHREHEAILAAVQDGDPERAVTQMAQHLAGTALRLMKDCSPDHEPYAVPAAVAMVGAASETPV
jgi:DNA-binding GntR family transcriptional regulator